MTPTIPTRPLALATLLGAALLSGCASLNRIDSDVTAYSRWPQERKPQTYAFERLPSQQAQPQQAQLLEDSARRAVESAGFQPSADPASADVRIQLGARITEYDRSPFDDPFWYGGRGPFHSPYAWGGYGRGWYGPGWRRGYGYGGWGYGWDDPYYTREVAVLIRDRRSGEPLYESRATSEGFTSNAPVALPAMFTAALRGFPAGDGQRHRVSVDPPPKPKAN